MNKHKNKVLLIIEIFLFVLLIVGFVYLSKSSKYTYSQGSVLDVLSDSTIYYKNSERELLDDLSNSSLYLNLKSNPEHLDIFDIRTSISLKNEGNLNIEVNNSNLSLSITSKEQGKIEYLYTYILNTLEKEKSKYLTLYRSVVLDSLGNIQNITYDSVTDTLLFDFKKIGYVDTRFLEMTVQIGTLTASSVSNTSSDYKLYDSSSFLSSWDYLLFKNDAIYGVACSDLGLTVLDSFNTLDDKLLNILDSNSIYQGISLESISTISDNSKSEPYKKVTNIDVVNGNSEEVSYRILVYFEDEVEYYKEDVINILGRLGYSTELVEDKDNCDLIIGYSWLFNNSLPSTFDDLLNESIIRYHNESNFNSTLELLLRTSWILGDAGNEKESE